MKNKKAKEEKMNLETKTGNETEKLEESAKIFVGFVEDRDYKKAREYFKSLNEEERKYIQREEKYSWGVRASSFSSM